MITVDVIYLFDGEVFTTELIKYNDNNLNDCDINMLMQEARACINDHEIPGADKPRLVITSNNKSSTVFPRDNNDILLDEIKRYMEDHNITTI